MFLGTVGNTSGQLCLASEAIGRRNNKEDLVVLKLNNPNGTCTRSQSSSVYPMEKRMEFWQLPSVTTERHDLVRHAGRARRSAEPYSYVITRVNSAPSKNICA